MNCISRSRREKLKPQKSFKNTSLLCGRLVLTKLLLPCPVLQAVSSSLTTRSPRRPNFPSIHSAMPRWGKCWTIRRSPGWRAQHSAGCSRTELFKLNCALRFQRIYLSFQISLSSCFRDFEPNWSGVSRKTQFKCC